MKKTVIGALAALTMGGALAASTVPASAEPHDNRHDGGGYGGGYRDHDRHRGDYGNAVGAGIIGLALGAALTNGYGNGYGYGYGPPAYYAPGYYYAPVPRCRVEMRWSPVWGGYDRVRVCY